MPAGPGRLAASAQHALDGGIGRQQALPRQRRVRFLGGRIGILVAVAAVVLLSGARAGTGGVLSARTVSASSFVTVAGGHLALGGAPWRFTGYDAYQVISESPGHQCGGAMSASQLNAIFDQIAHASGSVAVRVWFFQSYGAPNSWTQYDRVLQAAAAHGMKVIPTLVNQWLSCEPGPSDHPHRYRNVGWYERGYKATNDGYPLSFRSYAIDMAQHYADNPTIAFWQLVNEAEAADSRDGTCEETRAASALRNFADDVTAAMKAVDPNHLVNLGTMGSGQCGTAGSLYPYVNGGLTDICELHDYSHSALMGNSTNGTAPDISNCAAMGKPTFAGEVGIEAAVQPDWSTGGSVTAESLAQRATFFEQKIQGIFGLGGDGFLIWSKSLNASAHWWVGPGDPTEHVMLLEQQSLSGSAVPLQPGASLTRGSAPPRSHATTAATTARSPLWRAAASVGAALMATLQQQDAAAATAWLRDRER